MLLMDVKRAFNLVTRNCLLNTMESVITDGNLMRLKESFISHRNISLVIGEHKCAEAEVEK